MKLEDVQKKEARIQTSIRLRKSDRLYIRKNKISLVLLVEKALDELRKKTNND